MTNRLCLMFVLVVLGLVLSGAPMPRAASACCNDWMEVSLRRDLTDVQTSDDYKITLYNAANPNSTVLGQYTTSWLAFNLADCPPNPQLYQCQFSQVGFWTNDQGTRWWLYAEPGVVCFAGSHPDARSCMGDLGEFGVTIGRWTIYEMVHYWWKDDFWIVRVYDQNTVGHDVAKILSNSSTIFNAFADSEEIYSADPDPFLLLEYYLYHPEYMLWGTGFLGWPGTTGSGAQSNSYYMIPGSICPGHYGSDVSLAGDNRFWYDGTGGSHCGPDTLF